MVTLESERKAYPQYDEGEHDVLSLRDIIRIILNRLWVIVLVVLVLVGVAVGFSLAQTPTYESSIKVLVGQRQETGDSGSLGNLGNDIQGLQQLTTTLTAAVDSRPVAEAVTERLNSEVTPGSLLENLEAQQIPETQFIQVTYRDSDPERARLVANTVGEVFSELVSEVSPDANGVTATVWESAVVPNDPVSPNLKLNIFMALVLGVTAGAALVFVLEYLGIGRDLKGRETKKDQTSPYSPAEQGRLDADTGTHEA